MDVNVKSALVTIAKKNGNNQDVLQTVNEYTTCEITYSGILFSSFKRTTY